MKGCVLKLLFILLFTGFSAVVGARQIDVLVVSKAGDPIVGAVVEVFNGGDAEQAVDTQGAEDTQGNSLGLLESQPADVSQSDKAYSPYIQVVSAGGRVNFTNQDEISHHLYAVSGPTPFSFRLQAGEQHEGMLFAEEGVVPMGCNIHDWMSGYIKVVNSPFYGMTDEQGRLTLTVPDNLMESTIVAWHPQLQDDLSTIWLAGKQDSIVFEATKDMLPIPEQKPFSDIDFLGDY